MQYLCKEVFELVDVADAFADPDKVVVGGGWVTHNKEDPDNPKCRGRYVAQEINVNNEADPSFYAATHPLEAKRILMSRWAAERQRGGKNLKLIG